MPKTFEQRVKETIAMHEKMKPIYDERPISGERIAIERKGLEPVEVIIYKPEDTLKKTPDPTITEKKALRTESRRPVLINMHGGAFIGGDAVLLDSFCRMISDRLQAVVFNVNYKKAPEHPFPYAIEEVYDTAVHIAMNADRYGIDAVRMAICGHSAGASIAEGVALLAKTKGTISFVCQVLVYPCSDLFTSLDVYDKSCSAEEVEGTKDFISLYCQNNDSRHLLASPLLAYEEELEGVCPAIFLTCELDSLRFAGEAYAKKLIDCGVPVTCRRFKGALHGFLEVNRPDYFFEDNRKSEEQSRLCKEAEKMILEQLQNFYCS